MGSTNDATFNRGALKADGDLLTGVLPVPVVSIHSINDFVVERGGVRLRCLWRAADPRIQAVAIQSARSRSTRCERAARIRIVVNSQRAAHGGKPPKNMGC
jgi:hypothetical protein